ncbi:tumor necrosis factor receptor superfamily member 1B [Echeneis naucrates]|uniref:Tumor necrosis factor receptor superfamily member 1B-like n=1 Tax=Echeneis naucrates TaxID=173247 RepID=A0A665UR38_ECHNA|nr:tumor necrosis factor receptor superfamily member 1B-like [Echeneis naucrates]
MKEILVLVLLIGQSSEVFSRPYKVDSGGKCNTNGSEYLTEESNLCCKKCRPGERLIQECTETTDSVCEPCEQGQYIESWNFAQNCFSCEKCKSRNGLEYAQNCTSTMRAKCRCKAGMYCTMGLEDQYCTECRKYTLCKAGFGVSISGTRKSDVKCERCPGGTFSNTISYTDHCKPHTICQGNAVRKGNATSDTVCDAQGVTTAKLQKTTKEHVFTTASTMSSTGLKPSNTTLPKNFTQSTKHQPPPTVPDIALAASTAGVIGFIFLIIVIIVVCLYKHVWKKETAKFPVKVDANGNCESGDQINHGYAGETQLTLMTVYSPEQQCLLGKGDVCCDHSQSSNNTETLTRTDGSSNHESSGHLNSTVDLNNSYSALSEPMSLISNVEPAAPQPSVPSNYSSQPTSPPIISPHVNVNITLNIGNGSCGMPSVVPRNLMEADCEIPFGEEEKSFSFPQQEHGKESLMPVQDSASV